VRRKSSAQSRASLLAFDLPGVGASNIPCRAKEEVG
jgi:hypothetical protein